jgi:hypothetical protein
MDIFRLGLCCGDQQVKYARAFARGREGATKCRSGALDETCARESDERIFSVDTRTSGLLEERVASGVHQSAH